MKYTHLALALTSAIALAACGGSSNGSDHTKPHHDHGSEHSDTNNQDNTGQDHTNDHNNDISTFSTNVVTGEWGAYDYKTDKDAFGTVDNSGNKNVVSVQGKKIVIDIPSDQQPFIQMEDQRADMKASNHLSYARYGWIVDKQAGKENMFYQGNPTPASSLPTSATPVLYSGHAVYVSTENDGDTVTGTSNIAVNFSDKTVQGKLSFQPATLNFTAKIHGNAFHNGDNSNGSKVAGEFYGPHGEELAGGMTTPKAWTVFGAAKQ